MNSFCFVIVVSCCLVGAFAASDCEEHRQKELNAKRKANLIPKCDANGDYEALQCFEGSKFCMCWRPDGTHITAPSTAIKTCTCHVHRDSEIAKTRTGLVGNFIPTCNNSGTYARKQCHGSTGYCWCADENGNKVSDQVRGEINC
ncbi:U24-ctenitoxin-Pn1a-like [Argiope bruennichi]|uniref:U24-ctenitoxin-Pn1a like protein n=1 Tax=Argiope bruennichi TaxID=94029 RepID=A0A8T0EG44_ARGBR|nr:U24-ctenitoxin-Pn1a-like [Argiope bruennichi]KAF8771976.1 U24-ctenitoxin-Pn1a like protein [Argiope bruennichi]